MAGGCARLPAASSGAEARARFLTSRAAATGPIRGVGEMKARIGDRAGTFQARWGSSGESLVVVGYSGPVRALDATLLGDSIFLGIRRKEFGITGTVRAGNGIGADGVRFLLSPWDFSAAWMRRAIEGASVEPRDDGWRLRGEAVSEGETIPFTLDLSSRGEARELRLRPQAAEESTETRSVRIRYGAPRGYAAGRYPRWIEWERGDAWIRLDLRDVDRLPGGELRLLPPAPEDWRVVSLEDEEGREILGRLIGSAPGGER